MSKSSGIVKHAVLVTFGFRCRVQIRQFHGNYACCSICRAVSRLAKAKLPKMYPVRSKSPCICPSDLEFYAYSDLEFHVNIINRSYHYFIQLMTGNDNFQLSEAHQSNHGRRSTCDLFIRPTTMTLA